MKNSIYILLLSAAVILCSCSRVEGEIFGESSAQRLVHYTDSVEKLLTSAENGWEMIVFPTTDMQGINVLVKFTKDQMFTAAAKNSITTGNEYKEAGGSMWQMVSNQGPCLSFDTYNDVMHAFAEPTLDGYTKGVGMKGDYEFLVLTAEPNQLLLKSKKRGTYNLMRRLNADQGWEDYFKQIATKSGNTFEHNNVLTARVGNKEYALYNGSTGTFQLTEKGHPKVDSLCTAYPFAFTLQGLCLMNGFPGRKDVRILDMADETCYANGDVVISAGNVNRYVADYCYTLSHGWKIKPANLPQSTQQLVDAASAKLQQLGGSKSDGVTNLNIAYKQTAMKDGHKVDINTFVVQVDYKLTGKTQQPVNFGFTLTTTDVDLSLQYVGPTDDNSQKFLDGVPEIEAVFNALSGTYIATTKYPLNPSYGVTLTNKENAETTSISFTSIK